MTKESLKADEGRRCEVVGIGSPLLDIMMEIDQKTLDALGLKKGSMSLISELEVIEIANKMSNVEQKITPGGSAANTLSGVNALGNRVGLIGVIGDDEFGDEYEKITQEEGIVSHLHRHDKQATGRAFTFITPDGERTFATHLGAAGAVEKEHIQEERIKDAKILHIEAYQLEDPRTCKAILHAITVAKDHGTKISLDLSDAGLIARNKALFDEIVKEHVDVVFANEDEAKEFTTKEEEAALDELANVCEHAVVKLGNRGSLIKSGGKTHRIEPNEVEVENTNGAGDMYAAGILHGLINDLDEKSAGEIASHTASLVVASPGARLDSKFIDSIQRHKIN